MLDKFVKSTVMSLGILSALSLTSLLIGGVRANAEGTIPNPGVASQPNNRVTPINPQLNEGGMTQPANENAPTTPSTNPLSRYSPDQAPTLKYGSKGATVMEIQAYLQQAKLYDGPVDGVYGPQTRQAVKLFQESLNLSADGAIGRQTWEAMVLRAKRGLALKSIPQQNVAQ